MMIQAVHHGAHEIARIYHGAHEIARIYLGGKVVWESSTPIPVYAAGVGASYLHGAADADSAAAVHIRLSGSVTVQGTADCVINEVPQVRLWSTDVSRGNASSVTETTVRALLCTLVSDARGDAAGETHETSRICMNTESRQTGAAGGRAYGIVYSSGAGIGTLCTMACGHNAPTVHAGGVSRHEMDAGGTASGISQETAAVLLFGTAADSANASPTTHDTEAVQLFGTGGMLASLAGAKAAFDENYVYPIILKIADGDGDYPVSLFVVNTGEEYPLENVSEPVSAGDGKYIFTIT